jgi:hypothetical protein
MALLTALAPLRPRPLILIFKRRWVEVLEKPHSRPFYIERRRGP